MTKDDIIKIISIIGIAILYRNYCEGVNDQYEEFREEVTEILTKHFRVVVTSNDEAKSEESL